MAEVSGQMSEDRKKRTAEHRTRNNECRRKKTSSFPPADSIFDIQDRADLWLSGITDRMPDDHQSDRK